MPNTIADTELWDPVHEALADPNVRLIAWDGCHKMYVAKDDGQAEWFRLNYEYVREGSYEELLATLVSWWEDSCSLRFINAIASGPNGEPDKFMTLIGQFADYEDEED
jgi:hypothetical protein